MLLSLIAVVAVVLLLVTVQHSGAQTFGETEYVYEWTIMDYTWESESDREQAILDETYIPANNFITGVKVYNDDVYVTIPRWLPGVPSTMNKVVMVAGKPLLQPFPSWEMQEIGNCEKFQFTQSMEIVPQHDEMWAIDRGSVVGCPPKIVILSMLTGEVLHSHELPRAVINYATGFINDIVVDPVRQVSYSSDVGAGPAPGLHEGGIIVFDRATDTSHRLEHDSMHSEPDGGIVEINGEIFDYTGSPTDGIALSPDKNQLYWCPLGGYHLWQMPSAVARNPDGVNLDDVIRDLGPKVSQTDGMIMGHNGLYFGAMGLNAIYMWEYENDMADQDAPLEDVTMETQTRLVQDNVRMIWADTFAMDGEGWLWSTPNQLPLAFQPGRLNFTGDDINFRVSKTWVNDISYMDDAPIGNSATSVFLVSIVTIGYAAICTHI